MVVFTDEASHRPDERQLVVIGQGVNMAISVINITRGVSAPSRLLSMVGIVDDTHAAVDVGGDGRRRTIVT